MSKTAKTPPPKDFESALAELEALVERMESGQLSLEESLAGYRRGMELARYCDKTLTEAEQQVRILEGDNERPWSEATSGDSDAPENHG